MDVGFAQDAFRQAAANGREPEGAADVEGEVADAVAECQQGFHCGQATVAGGGGQAVEVEGVRRSSGDRRAFASRFSTGFSLFRVGGSL